MRRMFASALIVILVGSFVAVGTLPAHAAPITVTTTTDEYNTGTSCSLREAIQAANTDAAFGGCPAGSGTDTISLPGGTYTISIGGADDLNASGDFDVRTDMTIQGASTRITEVDGGLLDRVFHVEPPGTTVSATIEGLTIRRGSAAFGGGLRNDGNLTLRNVSVTDNVGTSFGGGIYSQIGTLTLDRVALTNNLAVDGGGLSNSSGTAILTNVTVSGNSVTEDGGGIASFGGGGTTILNNVTLAANTADSDADSTGNGGGFAAFAGIDTLANSIVARNIDGSPGGGSPDCVSSIASQGYNIIGDETGCTFVETTGDQVGTAASPVDPKVGSLLDNGGPTPTHALLAGSPALDAGNPAAPGSGLAACAAVDQRGVARNCDIGAYELAFCQGTVVNRVGTDAGDELTGTEGADGFLAGAGNDTMDGQGGDDTFCSGDGNDTALGASGNDLLLGEGGNDTLKGLSGNDTALGGDGRDRASGGSGKDLLKGDIGKDTLRGQGGKDRLRGGPGRDTCVGGGGKDRASCEEEKSVP